MFVIQIQQLEGITDQRHKCLCQIIVDLPWLPNRLFALTVKVEFVSQPENAWNTGNAFDCDSPRLTPMVFMWKNL